MRGHFFSHFQSDLPNINTARNIMTTHEMTEAEMEVVTAVFKSFETGLREATIYPKVIKNEFEMCMKIIFKDLLSAMKMLGLNPMEQDIMDLCNTVPKNGLIYFPDFCNIVLQRWREENEEVFRQNMFKVIF